MNMLTSSRNLRHRQPKQPQLATDAAVAELVQMLGQRLVRAGLVPVDQRFWDHVELILNSLPLTSEDYARSKQRLANARRYLHGGELGATRFELRMLQRRFSQQPL